MGNLVVSRKKDQGILIGNNIRVRVLKVKGQEVKLGFEAPPEVRIRRGEIEDKPKEVA